MMFALGVLCGMALSIGVRVLLQIIDERWFHRS